MDNVYLPSDRSPYKKYTGSGIKVTRPLTGETKKSNKFAYKNPIRTQKDLLYLSKGTMLNSGTPFSLPIRNAALNLNADMSQLKFTPRSGSLPQITDWEMGELIPERKPQGAAPPSGQPGGEPGEEPGEEPPPETGGEGEINNPDVPFTGKLTSENSQLSDAEYLSAVIVEEGFRPIADRGKNGRIVDAGYHFVPESSNDETSVFTDGNNVIVTLTGRPLLDQNPSRTAKDKLKIKEIAQHFKQEGKNGRIIVTGHAAGGALAGSAVRELLQEDPTLSQNLYGVTFNQLAGLGACSGPECENVVNLRVKGDIGSSMDTNYTREIDATCGERSAGDMAQFTGQRCEHETLGGKIMGSLNWFGESLIGNTWELGQKVTKAGAGIATTAAGGAFGAAVGGPVGAVAGATAGQAIYQKAAGAILGSDELKRRTLESAAMMRRGSKVKQREETALEGLAEIAGQVGGAALGTYAGMKAGAAYNRPKLSTPPSTPRSGSRRGSTDSMWDSTASRYPPSTVSSRRGSSTSLPSTSSESISNIATAGLSSASESTLSSRRGSIASLPSRASVDLSTYTPSSATPSSVSISNQSSRRSSSNPGSVSITSLSSFSSQTPSTSSNNITPVTASEFPPWGNPITRRVSEPNLAREQNLPVARRASIANPQTAPFRTGLGAALEPPRQISQSGIAQNTALRRGSRIRRPPQRFADEYERLYGRRPPPINTTQNLNEDFNQLRIGNNLVRFELNRMRQMMERDAPLLPRRRRSTIASRTFNVSTGRRGSTGGIGVPEQPRTQSAPMVNRRGRMTANRIAQLQAQGYDPYILPGALQRW